MTDYERGFADAKAQKATSLAPDNQTAKYAEGYAAYVSIARSPKPQLVKKGTTARLLAHDRATRDFNGDSFDEFFG